jgi:carbon monoxide dehydrogenase subunit G
MQIENEFEVAAPPDRVFSFLLDVNRVVGCMPGAELSEVVDPDNFKGRVKIKVGPITVAYNGNARIAERDETARRAVLQADGRETTGPGSARASAVMTVVPAGSGSMVKLATDFNVAGRIANFGRGVMEDVSRRLIGQMAQCIKSNLESEGADAAPPPQPAAATEPGPPGASASEAPAPAPGAGDAPGQPASRPYAPSPGTAADDAPSQPAARPYAPSPGAATSPARTAPPAAPVNALSLLFAVIWSRIKALFGRR